MADACDIEALWERAWAYCQERQQREYVLQPENWYTGDCPDGRQLLAVFDDVNATVCWLDDEGRHLNTEVVPHCLPELPGGHYQRDEHPELHNFFRRRFG